MAVGSDPLRRPVWQLRRGIDGDFECAGEILGPAERGGKSSAVWVVPDWPPAQRWRTARSRTWLDRKASGRIRRRLVRGATDSDGADDEMLHGAEA